MNKLITFFLLTSLLSSCTGKESKSIKTVENPNIIIVLTDDQGWADVGFNGGTDIPTPNLDAIAAEGVVFSNGYVSHPYCSPSRAGLLTGRFQARFGHDCNMPYNTENDDTVGTPLSEVMISEALKSKGYRTSAIGKWHVGDHPNLYPPKQGFDHWFGFPGGGMNYWGRSKDAIHTVYRNGVKVDENELTYLTDDFTDEAIQFINGKSEKPFFMYLAYNAPHAPNHATKKYLEQTKHIEYGGRSIYGAMVNAVDHNIGRIDSTLIANGQKENTIFVFLSDNGGRKDVADNRPNRGFKGMLFEGGIKVPFFIRWPNGIKKQQNYDEIISSLDLYPTFLDAIGEDLSNYPKLDGVSLLPYIQTKSNKKPHDLLFWRSVGGYEYAVRKGDYKLYKNASKEKTFLFDLKHDAYERNDISEENPLIVAELEKEYANWDKNNIAPGWIDPHIPNCIKDQKRWQLERNRSTKEK
ncbi:sulfatase-like hydrolase/transferase [Flavicella marina]|uniref:sulfatase-like hydrolase/transferase n=1 Tax=Flavicella marina TaxID=1475951 RepID=UPI00126473A5|nr:sulfatase-like hydrolase/transferase [Flavicella marina]